MSLLQCVGCQTRRRTVPSSSSILSTRNPRTLNLSNDDRTNVLDNWGSIQAYETTFALIDKAKRLIAKADKLLGESAIGLNIIPQSTPEHDGHSSTNFNLPTMPNIDQAGFDLVKSTKTLTQLKNRLSRFKNALSKTPENTRQCAKLQWQCSVVRQRIQQLKKNILMQ
jgi:hypothetical protein